MPSNRTELSAKWFSATVTCASATNVTARASLDRSVVEVAPCVPAKSSSSLTFAKCGSVIVGPVVGNLAIGGVKFAVYRATPFVRRNPSIQPSKPLVAELSSPMCILADESSV